MCAVLYLLTREGNSKAAVMLLQELAAAVQKEEPRNAQLAGSIVSSSVGKWSAVYLCLGL